MTRRSMIEREIARTSQIRAQIAAEISDAPEYKVETEWFKVRLRDIELLDEIIDDLTSILDVSVLA